LDSLGAANLSLDAEGAVMANYMAFQHVLKRGRKLTWNLDEVEQRCRLNVTAVEEKPVDHDVGLEAFLLDIIRQPIG